MKQLALTALLLPLLVVSCQQAPPVMPRPTGVIVNHAVIPLPQPFPQTINQAQVSGNNLTSHNPDAAFDQQVQAYAQEVYQAPVNPAQMLDPLQQAPLLTEQPTQNSNVGNMNYKVKITNGTAGRIFVEAQDAKGTIYPCGFMQKGQSFTTPMTNAQPVASPVLIVVRDPDQPGAPELRRYRIATPNASYANRTLHFTVIPKGSYSAAIDDQTYYVAQPED